MMPVLKVLVLYDSTQSFTNTVIEHLHCLSGLDDAAVYFCHAGPESRLPVPLAAFDGLIIHYSVRVAFERISASDALQISRFRGLKCLFIQDEYDCAETTRRWIELLGLHLVFTCVPADRREKVYPTSRFPRVTFVSNLTGYVPALLDNLPPPKPLRERRAVIGYRGRTLPPWYGTLAREKHVIGLRMRDICDRRGIPVDIAWDERARIYGAAWYEFLGSCRATLGTESGSNVFDDDGSIRRAIEDDVKADRSLSFDAIFEKHLRTREQPGLMNQVSPRIFEAIALRTALILFEGNYSGVVQADRHYLSLKKDFSNVDDVLDRLQDDACIEAMTERAYADVIASGRYSYQTFATCVRGAIDDAARGRRGELLPADEALQAHLADAVGRGAVTTTPHRAKPPVLVAAWRSNLRARARRVLMPIWRRTPAVVRAAVRPVWSRL